MHAISTVPTIDPELVNITTPEQNSSQPPSPTLTDPTQQSQPAPTNNIDLSSWMTPIGLQHAPHNATPPEDDNNIDDIYSDFEEENHDVHCSPPTIQRTSPVTIDPSETNIDTSTMHLHPANCEPVPTNLQDTPRVSIEDRPNSAFPKGLNITKEQLLQSIGYLDTEKLIKLLLTLAKEDTIHIQGDASPKINPGQTATMHNLKRSQKKNLLPTVKIVE